MFLLRTRKRGRSAARYLGICKAAAQSHGLFRVVERAIGGGWMNSTRAEVHLSMALNRLTRIVMGVPNVTDVAAYYRDFGLTPTSGEHCFGTVDGGEQLK